MVYSVAEKIQIFTCYIENNKDKRAAQRAYRELYPNRPTPADNTFRRIYQQVNNTGSFNRKRRVVHANNEDQLDVLLYFEGKPSYRYS
ncbi:Helix-turn-helix domain (DUF4817) [Popillia japonica]|uniref:Helix-turn-helix domain (DUF4817) n=1 Tax=Popillia japonica TaxID=7064 RepID=A0AAW1L638_POPJA